MPRYWFRQKNFGYGATPNTWQGWVLTRFSWLAVFGVVLAGPAIRDNTLRAVWMVLGGARSLVPVTVMPGCKTEGGWRWRNGRRTPESDLQDRAARRMGSRKRRLSGSAHDRADGFLHFSTAAQLPETLRLYYAGQDDLMLVAVDAAALGAALKWEHSTSRGEDFPHLYARAVLRCDQMGAADRERCGREFVLPLT